MKVFSAQNLAELPDDFRKNLINGISGFKSVNLLGTKDKLGQTNLTLMSSVFHVGAHPPLVGMIFRPHSVPRHGLENLLATEYFTINQVHRHLAKQAHQTSARYPKEVSEFKATGLTEEYSEGFFAPYVEESRIKMGLHLREHIPLKLNGTEIVIAEIVELKIPEEFIREDGLPLVLEAETIGVLGLDTYIRGSELFRLSYPKPDRPLKEIP